MRTSVLKIQRRWRDYLRWRREKSAVLIIERFFVTVKLEVDLEIQRREKDRKTKRSRRHRKNKEADDHLLERVWLNTMQKDGGVAHGAIGSLEIGVTESSRANFGSKKSKDTRQRNISQRAVTVNGASHHLGGQLGVKREDSTVRIIHKHNVSPNITMGNVRSPGGTVMQRERARVYQPPADLVDTSDDKSEISGLTIPTIWPITPTMGQATPLTSRFASLSRRELSDDLSLEEAFIDAEIQQVKHRMKADEKYIQRQGLSRKRLNTAPMKHGNQGVGEHPRQVVGSTSVYSVKQQRTTDLRKGGQLSQTPNLAQSLLNTPSNLPSYVEPGSMRDPGRGHQLGTDAQSTTVDSRKVNFRGSRRSRSIRLESHKPHIFSSQEGGLAPMRDKVAPMSQVSTQPENATNKRVGVQQVDNMGGEQPRRIQTESRRRRQSATSSKYRT